VRGRAAACMPCVYAYIAAVEFVLILPLLPVALESSDLGACQHSHSEVALVDLIKTKTMRYENAIVASSFPHAARFLAARSSQGHVSACEPGEMHLRWRFSQGRVRPGDSDAHTAHACHST
jgi:hypothetical protein